MEITLGFLLALPGHVNRGCRDTPGISSSIPITLLKKIDFLQDAFLASCKKSSTFRLKNSLVYFQRYYLVKTLGNIADSSLKTT